MANLVDGGERNCTGDKAPEEVQREAERKAIAQMAAGDGGWVGEDEDTAGDETEGGGEEGKGRRPRTRRRKA